MFWIFISQDWLWGFAGMLPSVVRGASGYYGIAGYRNHGMSQYATLRKAETRYLERSIPSLKVSHTELMAFFGICHILTNYSQLYIITFGSDVLSVTDKSQRAE
jgi:hypothetical protein